MEAFKYDSREKLFDTVNEYVGDGGADYAIFEAAMQQRIECDGYRMCDLMYEVYCLQREISRLWAHIPQEKKKVPTRASKAA